MQEIDKRQSEEETNDNKASLDWYKDNEYLSKLLFESGLNEDDNIEDNTNEEEYCLMCGNSGRSYNSPFECTKCGRKYVGEKSKKSILENDESSGLKIPRKYLEKGDWELSKTDGSGDGFYGNLDAIMDSYDYRKGGLDTVFVIAKPGSGCRLWAYTLLKREESKGAKVFPIVSLIDLMDGDNKQQLNSDLLIVTLQRYKLKESLEFLDYIMDSRETKGKDTIILTSIPKSLILREGLTKVEDTLFIVKIRE